MPRSGRISRCTRGFVSVQGVNPVCKMRNHQRIPGKGGEKGIPSPFSGTFLVNFHQEEARSRSPSPPSLHPPTERSSGSPRSSRVLLHLPSPPPGLVFPSCGGWARAGVRGESAPAALNGQVAATLVRLGVISSAEVSAGERGEGESLGGGGGNRGPGGGLPGPPPHPQAGD